MLFRSRDNQGRPAVYLGDGAYAAFDGVDFEVYTSDGISVTNRVVLDFAALQHLVNFAAACGSEGRRE